MSINVIKTKNKTPQSGNSIQPKATPWDNSTEDNNALKGQLISTRGSAFAEYHQRSWKHEVSMEI